MEISLSKYDALIHSIYQAALRTETWPEVVRNVADMMNAPRALLFSFSLPTGAVGFTYPHNISQDEIDLYASRGVHDDPFLQSASKSESWRNGTTFLDTDLITRDALIRTTFYRDIWQPLNIGKCIFGIVFDGSDSLVAPTSMSVYRPPDHPEFDSRERQVFRQIVGHLSRSLGVMFHLRDARQGVASSFAALDLLSHGVVMLDHNGNIKHANLSARSILESNGPLRLTRIVSPTGKKEDRLALDDGARFHAAEFSMLIKKALFQLGDEKSDHFSNCLVLTNDNRRPLYVIHASPLGRFNDFAVANAPPSGIVFIHDLRFAHSSAAKRICEIFKATPAEAKAALETLRGGTNSEMAVRLGVSTSTFKTQLQSCYEKTGTHRQSELLKLLIALSDTTNKRNARSS